MFVGRVAELSTLSGALGTGGVIEVVGEPGIGKTRLLTQFAAAAGERGHTVLRGRATEFEHEMPYAVFTEALGEEPAGDRLTLVRTIRAQLMERAPLALILDDLHWADPASVELLAHLIRRPMKQGVLLVCAYRSRQAGPRLLGALAEAGPAAVPADRLELGPLTFDEAESLVGPRPGLRSLHEKSGGNPLYLEALAARASEGHDRVRGDSLAGLLLGEVALLAAAELLAAQAAAVLGDQFTPSDVATVVGGDCSHELDALAVRDLLRSMGDGRLMFRHPLLRQLIYERSDPAWRMSAHRTVARELIRLGAPTREVAHHISRTANRHEPEDVKILVEAAKEALPTAPAAAAEWLIAALPLLGDPHDFESVGVRVLLTKALIHDGRLEEARRLMHELIPHMPPGTRAEVVAACAAVERLLSRYPESISLLTSELASGGHSAWLHRELATLRLQTGDVPGALAETAEAIAAAETPEDEAAAHALLAFSAAYEGQPEATAQAIAESAGCSDGLSDASAARDLTCLTRLAWAELFMEKHADAERHVRRALRLARPLGRSGLLADALTCAAQLCCRTGRLAEAFSFGEEAEDVAHQSGSPSLLALFQAIHAETLSYLDLPQAVRQASRAADAVEGSGWWAATTLCLAAQVLVVGGEPDRARWMLLGVGGGVGLPGIQPGYRPMWLETLAQATLACDDLAWARAAANASLGAADALGLPAQRAFALRAQASVLAAEEQPVSASVLADQAIALFQETGMRLQTARTLIMSASARLPEDGLKAVATARAIAVDCGATVLTDDAERERKRLAARGRRKGGEVLTPRERQIAELAMTGMSSKEIAKRLMLSSRTVDDHLAKVYRKLGVNSRAAIAQALG
ncbi:AAA family ATPase [Streptosporangiaceae bacterium NEAU-GS5]|nr:AAA family ATPase [Streptosporangiaceae bacterium NEAU-GS5]